MKLGFYHEIQDADTYWKDGLWAALQLIGKEHNLRFFEDGDVTMIESGSHGAHMMPIIQKRGKKIWFHAGGEPEDYNFDHVVVLADEIKRKFERKGIHAVTINGTNIDLFKPMPEEKFYDVIFPAAFASWKRHWKLIDWVRRERINPSRVLVVGHKQAVEQECFKQCEEAGFEVRGKVTPEELAVLYNQSKECWIPSSTVGGSEKTLLEARACGLNVRVAEDNERLMEMLQQPVNDHHYYAEEIKKLL